MSSPHLMQNTAIADGIDGGTSCIKRYTTGSRGLEVILTNTT